MNTPGILQSSVNCEITQMYF